MIRVLICLWAVLAPLGVINTWAEQDPKATASQEESEPQKYPVMLEGKVLFHISRDVHGLSGRERAAIISKRLKQIADTPTIDVASIKSADFELPVTLLTKHPGPNPRDPSPSVGPASPNYFGEIHHLLPAFCALRPSCLALQHVGIQGVSQAIPHQRKAQHGDGDHQGRK